MDHTMSSLPSRQVEFFPTALKEFEWRNGYFYRYSCMAGVRTAANGIQCARHTPGPCPRIALTSAEVLRSSPVCPCAHTRGRRIEMPDSTPLHTEYLELAVERGAISQATLDEVQQNAPK